MNPSIHANFRLFLLLTFLHMLWITSGFFAEGVAAALLTTLVFFCCLMRIKGQEFLEVSPRQIVKVMFEQHNYLIKYHQVSGWLGIIKNWMTLKRKVVSALREMRPFVMPEDHRNNIRMEGL